MNVTMINRYTLQNIKFTPPAQRSVRVSFGENSSPNSPNENKQSDEYAEFSTKDGLKKYLYEIRLIKRVDPNEEIELGKKINAGREAEEIIKVIQNETELKENIKYSEKIKDFFKSVEPDNAEKILQMAEQDKSIYDIKVFLLNNKKPSEFINSEKVVAETIVKEASEKISSNDSGKILNHLLISLKQGYETQRLINNVTNYKNEGKVAKQDEIAIKNGQIPEKYQKALDKSQQAQNKLILANTRLVPYIARRLEGKLELEDKIGEGNIGLIEAVKKFDYTKNIKFSTYAWHTVEGYIQMAELDKADLIRIPRHHNKAINEYNKAEETNMSDEEQQRIQELNLIRKPISLSNPVGEDDENTLNDFISDDVANSQDEEVIKNDISASMLALLKKAGINANAAKILLLRNGEDDPSHQDVANELGNTVTRERIRQIEADAMEKLKSNLKVAQKAALMPPEEKQRILTTMKQVLEPQELRKLRAELGFNDGFGNIIARRGKKPKNPTSSHANGYLSSLEKLEKVGITLDDIKSCREMPVAQKFLELWSTFPHEEECLSDFT